ncbi:hypothetical protein F5B22DRAFT_125552 [Xylaria bambusicola]|uniref:uncharacterized protein n=1 Tax=Xylaria bambusicola TaxID=326684 RepID=UPI002007B83E|nr:uncharacterized protein F5B22DRAFT_125552 [Xylaria bambusicola]KAI0517079.1 hypothetical protein F5B22DRAFT_125552 [Xylaria bambusicola]
MYRLLCSLSLLASAAVGALASDLKIDVTLPVECERQTKKGDTIEVHYRGTLASNGNKFDASYDRGTPFVFPLGAGRVIKGWDEGLLDMCIGEKRTLTVPPEMGYGNRGMGPIPAGSTLVFETELIGIKGVPKPETIVTKATASSSEEAAAETETGTGTAGKVAEKIGEAAEVIGTMLADTDDVQEHNEL